MLKGKTRRNKKVTRMCALTVARTLEPNLMLACGFVMQESSKRTVFGDLSQVGDQAVK